MKGVLLFRRRDAIPRAYKRSYSEGVASQNGGFKPRSNGAEGGRGVWERYRRGGRRWVQADDGEGHGNGNEKAEEDDNSSPPLAISQSRSYSLAHPHAPPPPRQQRRHRGDRLDEMTLHGDGGGGRQGAKQNDESEEEELARCGDGISNGEDVGAGYEQEELNKIVGVISVGQPPVILTGAIVAVTPARRRGAQRAPSVTFGGCHLDDAADSADSAEATKAAKLPTRVCTSTTSRTRLPLQWIENLSLECQCNSPSRDSEGIEMGFSFLVRVSYRLSALVWYRVSTRKFVASFRAVTIRSQVRKRRTFLDRLSWITDKRGIHDPLLEALEYYLSSTFNPLVCCALQTKLSASLFKHPVKLRATGSLRYSPINNPDELGAQTRLQVPIFKKTFKVEHRSIADTDCLRYCQFSKLLHNARSMWMWSQVQGLNVDRAIMALETDSQEVVGLSTVLGQRFPTIRVSGGIGGQGGTGVQEGGTGGNGEGPTFNFSRAEGWIVHLNDEKLGALRDSGDLASTVNSAPRAISLCDINLQREVCLNDSRVCFRRPRDVVRKYYTAEVKNRKDMTVVFYKGQNTEEEFKKDVAKYMDFR
ncbi:hypothetical protein R3P38DRAFT_2775405 [Favolaschia claudopus]|uniref:Uncharacterized protein n=1 Tax=Favolaschia claudopus TaxID=2862362 RepID=A0AAW0BUL0_9AGAR